MSSAETDASGTDAESATDRRLAGILETLQAGLGQALVGSELAGGDLWVRVDAGSWRSAVSLCRDRVGMDYFCFLSGLDWMPSAPDAEVSGGDVEGVDSTEGEASATDAPDEVSAAAAEAERDASGDPAGAVATEETAATADPSAGGSQWTTGVAGGDTRFQVIARLYSTTTHVGVTLKADLDDSDPRVESVHDVYRGADWHERETWEMYGFTFLGHPHLAHLYLPGEFEGHPLRKDFPLLAREVKPWPGIVDVEAMPQDESPAAEGEEG